GGGGGVRSLQLVGQGEDRGGDIVDPEPVRRPDRVEELGGRLPDGDRVHARDRGRPADPAARRGRLTAAAVALCVDLHLALAARTGLKNRKGAEPCGSTPPAVPGVVRSYPTATPSEGVGSP